MSKVIAVNAGSSSLKFQLFEMDNETVITSGVIERIGMEDSIFTIKYNGEKDVRTLAIPTHKEAVHLLLDTLIEKQIVSSLDEIKGVGHRVVQGGSYFQESAIIDEDVINKIPGVTVDITSGLDNFYAGIEKAQQKVKDESGWVEYVKSPSS